VAKRLKYFAHGFEDALRRNCEPSALAGGNCVFDLFELEFKQCPSKGVAKLFVQFTDDASKHLKSVLLLNVLHVYVYLDLKAFVRYGRGYERRRFYLDSILACMNAYADEYGWDRVYYLEVYRRLLSTSITFDRFWKKAVKCDETGCRAQVHVSYSDSIDLRIVVFDSTNTPIRSKLIARLAPTIGALNDAHGDLIWSSTTEIRLYRENKRDFWRYDLATDVVDFVFPRAERGDPHGQYDLGMMYLQGYLVFPDREKAVYWIRQAAEQGFTRAAKRLALIESPEQADRKRGTKKNEKGDGHQIQGK